IHQLTYLNNVGFSYIEEDTFELIETFHYEWSGWGLTHDGTHLIASDGSALLRFLDPATKELHHGVPVEDDGDPVYDLNELEYIAGRIYANVWFSDLVAIIHPESGNVSAWVDFGGLRDSVDYDPDADVLNGIAFDPVDLRIFVTGKRWPKLFEVDLGPLHPTAVADEAEPAPEAPWLMSRPNPCTHQTQLVFDLPRNGRASVRIFDVRGRLVRQVGRQFEGAGLHTIDLDVRDLPAGAYFIKLAAGRANRIQKLLIVR
ncbi:MAG: T9SS type A sorting domain-containing protein, partial [Candidatus Eisenbacteria bacterium]|nr:T9SS type A sorting domain-containing protein [Candidatus Eisenbacteria bacterium]